MLTLENQFTKRSIRNMYGIKYTMFIKVVENFCLNLWSIQINKKAWSLLKSVCFFFWVCVQKRRPQCSPSQMYFVYSLNSSWLQRLLSDSLNDEHVRIYKCIWYICPSRYSPSLISNWLCKNHHGLLGEALYFNTKKLWWVS